MTELKTYVFQCGHFYDESLFEIQTSFANNHDWIPGRNATVRMFGKNGGNKRIKARQRPREIMVGPAEEGSGRLTNDTLGPPVYLPEQLFPCSRDRRRLQQKFHRGLKRDREIRKALS